ncbi:aldo/keto reductase [Dellaglioa sp. L3N]
MEYTVLNNGVKVPLLGLGVYLMDDLEKCEESVLMALNAGYRLIDTSSAYMNEEAVGRAIKRSGVPRSEIFVTTKLWIQDAGYEKAKKGFETSLKNLQLDYLDLYLIHQPFGNYYGSWKAMEELYQAGKIRSIGVSNFNGDRLVDLILNNKIIPVVNQIEFHPEFQQKKDKIVLQEAGVQLEAWSPLGHGGDVLNNVTLFKIGQKYNKTVAQVILRWETQLGIIVIPKSTHKARIKENIDIFDFKLTETEIEIINKLDTNKRIADVTNINLVRRLNSLKIR